MTPILYESTDLLFKKPALAPEDLFQKLYSFALKFAPDVYKDAVAEAARIAEQKGIDMTVEGLKPVHLGWSDYKLPVGETFVNLKENVVVYPVGIFSTDPDFDSMSWWNGAKTEYLFDWFTKPVAATLEKQMIMTPQPVFKEGAFTFSVHSEVPKPKVDAWIIAYVVLPRTMKEQKITR